MHDIIYTKDPKWKKNKETKEIVNEFISLLQEDIKEAQHTAAYVLGEIADPMVVKPLKSLSEKHNIINSLLFVFSGAKI